MNEIEEKFKKVTEIIEDNAKKTSEILLDYKRIKDENIEQNDIIKSLLITLRWVSIGIVVPLSIVAIIFIYCYFCTPYSYGNMITQIQDGASSSQLQTIGGN